MNYFQILRYIAKFLNNFYHFPEYHLIVDEKKRIVCMTRLSCLALMHTVESVFSTKV